MRLIGADITIERGARRLFSGLSFEAGAGAALIVTGPNGAGKSSLLRAIAGLLRIAAGDVRLEGGDAERSIGEQAHYLGHADALKAALTAGENLAFWAAMLRADAAPMRRAIRHSRRKRAAIACLMWAPSPPRPASARRQRARAARGSPRRSGRRRQDARA